MNCRHGRILDTYSPRSPSTASQTYAVYTRQCAPREQRAQSPGAGPNVPPALLVISLGLDGKLASRIRTVAPPNGWPNRGLVANSLRSVAWSSWGSMLWESGAPDRLSADSTPVQRGGQSKKSVGPSGGQANQIGLESAKSKRQAHTVFR